MDTSKKPSFSTKLDKAAEKHQDSLAQHHKALAAKSELEQRDIELALAVILVELAASDQNFEQTEYGHIASALKSILGTGRSDVSSLVNQAGLILANLRGTSGYVATLKDNLETTHCQAIMSFVDDIVSADGKTDGYEIYLKNKLSKGLGLS